MSDTNLTGDTPAETKGVNVNYRPCGDHWVIEMTPNPTYVHEALRPRWRAIFRVQGFKPNNVFTHAQMLSQLSITLEEIAAERIDAEDFAGSL